MPCELTRSALADVAAGAPAPAAAEAHLAACPTCRDELRRLREALALADAALVDLAAAEPSPALRSRIRRSVAEARGPRLTLPWPWAWAAAAAVAVVLASAALWRAGPPASTEAALTVPAAAPLAPPGLAAASPAAAPEVAVGANAPPPALPVLAPAAVSVRPAGRPRREPEVLVPAGGLDALVRLLALAHEERAHPTLLSTAGEPSAELADPAPLEIAPLEIAPLDPAEDPDPTT